MPLIRDVSLASSRIAGVVREPSASRYSIFAMSLTHNITVRCLLERPAQAFMRSQCAINLTAAVAVTVEDSFRKLAAMVRA
jgi:hypothetical protein